MTTLKTGVPRLANVNVPGGVQFKRNEARGKMDWGFLARLRDQWPGNLSVKGVLGSEDAVRIRDAGVYGPETGIPAAASEILELLAEAGRQ